MLLMAFLPDIVSKAYFTCQITLAFQVDYDDNFNASYFLHRFHAILADIKNVFEESSLGNDISYLGSS